MIDFPAARVTLWLSVLNNDALLEKSKDEDSEGLRMVGDPTEGSLLVAAVKAGIYPSDTGDEFPRRNEIPFDSQRKRMVTIHSINVADNRNHAVELVRENAQEYVIAVKGAPDIVLGLCAQYLNCAARSRCWMKPPEKQFQRPMMP